MDALENKSFRPVRIIASLIVGGARQSFMDVIIFSFLLLGLFLGVWRGAAMALIIAVARDKLPGKPDLIVKSISEASDFQKGD